MVSGVKSKQLSKKETQKLVFEKLSEAMIDYKGKLKEKKFISSLKKVSKQFATDIVKSTKQKNESLKEKRKKAY